MKVAHELGHALGRKHTPGPAATDPDPNYPYTSGRLGATGFNAFTREAIPLWDAIDKTFAHDVMSYGTRPWISDYTWRHLFEGGFSRAIPRSAADRAPPDQTDGTTRVAFVRGLIGSGGLQLQTIWVHDIPTMILPRPENGQLEVRARDASGTLLARRGFTPEPNPTSNDGLQIIDTFVIFPKNAARIEIYDAIEIRVLGGRNVSLSPPEVVILTSADGETHEPDGTITLEWNAVDADRDPTRAWVQFSADGGRTWENLGKDLEGTRLDAPVKSLRGTDDGRFRVAVSDGLRTTAVATSAFAIADMPPSAWILQGGELEVAAGDLIRLSGSASDREDDDFPPSAYVWTSDREGELGSGPIVEMRNASLGTHVVRLTVTDSMGQSASAEIVVVVGEPTEDEGGFQFPGDANQDGSVDLSDSLSLLGTLFLGSPSTFPCSQSATPGAGDVALLDWNGDAQIDLSDAVASLLHLFLGDSGHPLGTTTACVSIVGCSEIDGCRG